MVILDFAPTDHTIRLNELPSDWTTELQTGGSTCVGLATMSQEHNQDYERAIDTLQIDERRAFAFLDKPENSWIDEVERLLAIVATSASSPI